MAGDIRVQWPVLAVPLLWALVALRPRRRSGARVDDVGFWDGEPEPDPSEEPEDAGGGAPERRAERPIRDWQPPPPTRETQVLPPLPPREDRRGY